MAKTPLTKTSPFQKGDKVFLDSRNIQLPYPSRKFAPRREGPFLVTEVLSPTTGTMAASVFASFAQPYYALVPRILFLDCNDNTIFSTNHLPCLIPPHVTARIHSSRTEFLPLCIAQSRTTTSLDTPPQPLPTEASKTALAGLSCTLTSDPLSTTGSAPTQPPHSGSPSTGTLPMPPQCTLTSADWPTRESSTTGHYGVLHIADIAINQIANPTIIRLLRDLLPSRHQHLPGYRHPYSSPTRTTSLYDIPTSSNTNRTKGNAWGSPSATGGWGTPPSEWTTDPWAITKPDTPPPSDQEAENDQCSGRASDAPPPLVSVRSAGPADWPSSPQPQSIASSSLLAFVDEDGLLPTRRDRPLNHHNDDEAPRKAVTWVDRALGAITVASRGAQP
ncbi:hypothetical protein L227DRAFT_611763 [Lentinus tigrinus ALCF2SS1-6]|uniref:Uncharacterized protein n=1 Tax=Lentinus tigrinus ALCF2SS1-6 TaxID=1328759 RepID=A0A5C2S9X2_9APHY|nr:hypothetical protein L227DRAFT_611763 [Lentinus tigrinus ALCF2SS1-6]